MNEAAARRASGSVRVWAGHADLRTTQRYVHASGADSVTAITRVGGN